MGVFFFSPFLNLFSIYTVFITSEHFTAASLLSFLSQPALKKKPNKKLGCAPVGVLKLDFKCRFIPIFINTTVVPIVMLMWSVLQE